jgi:transcription initiation factor TFIIIB Brf1 subunit/transcription initiation factor TFIIB
MSDDDTHTSLSDKSEAIDAIQAGCDRLDLDASVCDTAKQVFKARNGEIDRDSPISLEPVAGAAIYAGIKVERGSVPIGTVCDELGVGEKAVFRELKRVEDAVDIPIPIETPSMFVPGIVDRLAEMEEGVDPEAIQPEIERTKTAASEIATELTETGYVSGCSGSGIAAATVYALCRVAPWAESVPSQQCVAEAADVSVVTIRDHYRDILDEVSVEDYINDDDTDTVDHYRESDSWVEGDS